jgi:hypothetical protein
MTPDNKILNPKTGRHVSKTGLIGIGLMNKHIDCTKVGMEQSINTCWFNAIFNSMLLSQKVNMFFMNKYRKLPIDERQAIEKDTSPITCPLKLRKSHFYKYIYKYSFNSKTSKTHLIPEKLINGLDIRPLEWEKDPEWDPRPALEITLPIIFDKPEYRITDVGYKYQDPSKKTKFIFIQYSDDITTPVHKLHTVMFIPNSFKLDHAVIDIHFENLIHSVAGYVCNSIFYMYDSNESQIKKIDWKSKIKLTQHFNKVPKYKPFGKVVSIGYSYVCYSI